MIGVFAVYGLYASAASLRDRAAAHTGLGENGVGGFPITGTATAALGAVALFVLPALVRSGGYPGASAAMIAVTLPLAAAPLVLRAWGLARATGARGLGELLAHHYGTGVAALAGLCVVAAATLVLTLVLIAAGHLVAALMGRGIGPHVATYLSALFVALTAAPAGIRTAGAMARVHAALVVIGGLALVGLVVSGLGGPRAAIEAAARTAELLAWGTTEGRGGGDYPAALAVAGATHLDGGWSSMAVSSIQCALAGALLVLVWMPWSLAARDPRSLARPLARTSAALGGALLFAVALVVGLAALALDPALAPKSPEVPPVSSGFASGILPVLAARLGDSHPWIGALVGLAAAAALHALALALLAAAVGALRPLWSGRLHGLGGSPRDLAAAQVVVLALIAIAAVVASAPPPDLPRWSDAGLSLAALVALPIAAACWFPTLTSNGLAAGFVVGAAVALIAIASAVAPDVHGALPALVAAATTAVLLSALRPRDSRRARRLDAARRVGEAVSPPGEDRMHALPWLAALAWIFFAIGPGIVVGNDLFGAPNVARAEWQFTLPSLAVWLLLSWIMGTALVWYLARRLAAVGRDAAQRLGALSAPRPTDRQTADR